MPETKSSQETVFYSDGKGVRVTNSRLIIDRTTYTMRNITSVSKARTDPNRVWPVVLFGIGVILLAPGLQREATALVIAILFLLAGTLVWAQQKAEFHVRISSASEDPTVLTSRDEKYVESILLAPNEAIIHRG